VLAPQIEVSEQEMMDYYEVHQSEFHKPVQYRIQQITVNTETEGDDVIQNLQQGADFAWIAKKMSQDDTSDLGGMLGWVTENKLPVEARQVVRALEIGEVSPLVKIRDFYRIYRVQNKTEGAVKEFNEVKPLIYREVSMDKYTKLYKQYIDGLKKAAEITVYDKEVEEVRQMFKQ
jgi:foldase protein PrsA